MISLLDYHAYASTIKDVSTNGSRWIAAVRNIRVTSEAKLRFASSSVFFFLVCTTRGPCRLGTGHPSWTRSSSSRGQRGNGEESTLVVSSNSSNYKNWNTERDQATVKERERTMMTMDVVVASLHDGMMTRDECSRGGFDLLGKLEPSGKWSQLASGPPPPPPPPPPPRTKRWLYREGVSFVIVIVFYLIFRRGGEPGKIATKANRHAIESLLSSHRRAGWSGAEGSRKMCKLFLLYTAINRWVEEID